MKINRHYGLFRKEYVMKKDTENNVYRKISIKDITIIIISIIALISLVIVVSVSKKNDADRENELNSIGKDLEDKQIYRIDEALGELLINEVSGNGWIEFYNAGTNIMDLGDITIYINGVLRHTVKADTTLQVNGYYIVEFVSGIGLNHDDIISVYNSSNQCIINLIVPKMNDNESYGRVKDGDSAMVIMKPTKGGSNEGSERVVKEEMYFSVPGGFYNSAITLDFVAKEGTRIFYTLDGTTPDLTSEEYTGSILISNRSGSGYTYAATKGLSLGGEFQPSSINMGTVVKAIAVYPDGTLSEVMTETYFVGIGFGSDYVNIPVISLSVDSDEMFGYFNGMYVAGRKYEDSVAKGVSVDANFLQDWSRVAHIEYYETNKYKTYEADINISLIKDYSITSAQKSIMFTSDDELILTGSTLEKYLNSDKPYFMLRTYKRDNNYKIREAIVNNLLKNTGAGTKQINPCILFINGEYWGGYVIENVIDNDYIRKMYDIDDEIVWIRDGAIYGDDSDKKEFEEIIEFITKSDMSRDENYNKVAERLDIQSYLDYLCANMYLANADYGKESYTIWRTKTYGGEGYSDGRWRFILGEMDNTINNGANGNVATPTIDTFLQPGVQEDVILNALIKNDRFKKLLEETMDNMINNIFSEENIEAVINEQRELIERMARASYRRFNGEATDNFYSSEIEKIEEFFEKRGEYIKVYTDEIIKNGVIDYGDKIKDEDANSDNKSEKGDRDNNRTEE